MAFGPYAAIGQLSKAWNENLGGRQCLLVEVSMQHQTDKGTMVDRIVAKFWRGCPVDLGPLMGKPVTLMFRVDTKERNTKGGLRDFENITGVTVIPFEIPFAPVANSGYQGAPQGHPAPAGHPSNWEQGGVSTGAVMTIATGVAPPPDRATQTEAPPTELHGHPAVEEDDDDIPF